MLQGSLPHPRIYEDAVEAELMKMLDNDIIQYDETIQYCSPLIVVRKHDRGIRLVNNFIKLNSTEMPTFPVLAEYSPFITDEIPLLHTFLPKFHM